MGMKIKREMEKVEKIRPTSTPSAPSILAYTGKRGAIIPMPKLETATERARIRKTVLKLGSGFAMATTWRGSVTAEDVPCKDLILSPDLLDSGSLLLLY
jgi:hypothetical protein